MNEQYRQEQSRGNRRPSQGSITSTSTMKSYKGRSNPGGYAIETSFCGAKPIVVPPSTYDLSSHHGSDERSTPPQRINQSEESLTGKVFILHSRRSAIFKNGSWKRVPNKNHIVFMYHI